MRFYVGLHIPAHAYRFDRCMVSINVLRRRRSDFAVNDWILDSGAFTQVVQHGGYDQPPEAYAAEIQRWARCGRLLAAVSQDYMCEAAALRATGLSVAEHQRRTIARYARLRNAVTGVYIMPVLQGYTPASYKEHIAMYGPLLEEGAWVGVGSICKRNGDPKAIVAVLRTIKRERPDLRLHGFGIKLTALRAAPVRRLLTSADSMAWSFAARAAQRDANSWHEAEAFRRKVAALTVARSPRR